MVPYWSTGTTKLPMVSFEKVIWDHTRHTFDLRMTPNLRALSRKSFDVLNQVRGKER